MRTAIYRDDCSSLLERDGTLAVADFRELWPDVPMPTVYSRIRSLEQEGRLSSSGKGRYQAIPKVAYTIPVTEQLRTVRECLFEHCEGVDSCLYEKDGNLYVEVYRGDIPKVESALKQHFPKVIRQKDAKAFPARIEGYIIIGNLVTDAPLVEVEDILFPSLEKTLVDSMILSKDNEREQQFELQKAMEAYPVNLNRMKRYAARRGVMEELSDCLSSLNTERLKLFSTTQKYLAGIPVLRAWVFGSFARGEETPESDLDLLVDYDPNAGVSLLDIVRYRLDLKKLIGREVDLIENGYLKPFAAPSAEHDKYLVYER